MSEIKSAIKIHVYSAMQNEEILLPYFLRHYSLFADRIFIIDDKSTDRTVKIAKSNSKVTLLNYKFSNGYNEEEHVECFIKFYKKHSRGKADWVMCVDGDEFIYNPDIIANLKKQQDNGLRIIKTTGYAMISKKLPKTKGQIYKELPYGLRERRWDKPCVFDPKLDIVFGSGRHSIKSPAEVPSQSGKLSMLHYRYLSREYFRKRSYNLISKLNISDELKTHLITGGLKFYDQAIKADLVKIV